MLLLKNFNYIRKVSAFVFNSSLVEQMSKLSLDYIFCFYFAVIDKKPEKLGFDKSKSQDRVFCSFIQNSEKDCLFLCVFTDQM